MPADLEAIVMRCLGKAPADRYASASELEEALSACDCAARWDVAQAEIWWKEMERVQAIDPSTELAFEPWSMGKSRAGTLDDSAPLWRPAPRFSQGEM